jgi:hypothetical protein
MAAFVHRNTPIRITPIAITNGNKHHNITVV